MSAIGNPIERYLGRAHWGKSQAIMKNQTAFESTATSSGQVIRNVLEGRANGRINDAIADFAEKFRFKDYGIGIVTLFAWVGISAVLLLGLIFCSAAAVGLVVSHLPQ